MSASSRSSKDKEMAARLKAEGVCRVVARCPTCYKVVSLNHLPQHIAHFCGRD